MPALPGSNAFIMDALTVDGRPGRLLDVLHTRFYAS
jgi:hypothetical protein